MKHYTEADLLELFYLPPADFLPMRVHLAECAECTMRYDGLQKKLQVTASCGMHEDQPQTFWDRQRFSVMRTIQMRPQQMRRRSFSIGPLVAAAAVALIVVSGVLFLWPSAPESSVVASESPIAESASATTDDPASEIFQELRAVNDPWSSEELQPFHDVVEWESWTVEGESAARGES